MLENEVNFLRNRRKNSIPLAMKKLDHKTDQLVYSPAHLRLVQQSVLTLFISTELFYKWQNILFLN